MTLAFSIFAPFEWLADAVVRTAGLSLNSTWGAAIGFFVYEIGKVSVLIFAISWLMALYSGLSQCGCVWRHDSVLFLLLGAVIYRVYRGAFAGRHRSCVLDYLATG